MAVDAAGSLRTEHADADARTDRPHIGRLSTEHYMHRTGIANIQTHQLFTRRHIDPRPAKGRTVGMHLLYGISDLINSKLPEVMINNS